MSRGDIIRGTAEPVRVIESGGARSAAPASRSLPKFFPTLEPSYQVALSASAGNRIRSELRRERYLETGGWLFADPHDSNLVVAATGPGSDGGLSPRSLQLGEEEMELVKRMAPRLSRIGDWHQHVSGDLFPSETDRRAWQRGCELTRSHWIGLVYAPAVDMWSQPTCAAYITVGSGETFFCERLALKEL
jgi:proteasome lid subunit RPN8/RPN11